MFVNYNEQHKAYKLFDGTTNNVTINCEVQWLYKPNQIQNLLTLFVLSLKKSAKLHGMQMLIEG
jgi:hypothetical protein